MNKLVTFQWSDIVKKLAEDSKEVNNMRKKAAQQALSGVLLNREKTTAEESKEITDVILLTAAVS